MSIITPTEESQEAMQAKTQHVPPKTRSGGGGDLPSGGTEGQVLTMGATAPEWADIPEELPSGGTQGQVLTMGASAPEWANPSSGGGSTEMPEFSISCNQPLPAAKVDVTSSSNTLSGDFDADTLTGMELNSNIPCVLTVTSFSTPLVGYDSCRITKLSTTSWGIYGVCFDNTTHDAYYIYATLSYDGTDFTCTSLVMKNVGACVQPFKPVVIDIAYDGDSDDPLEPSDTITYPTGGIGTVSVSSHLRVANIENQMVNGFSQLGNFMNSSDRGSAILKFYDNTDQAYAYYEGPVSVSYYYVMDTESWLLKGAIGGSNTNGDNVIYIEARLERDWTTPVGFTCTNVTINGIISNSHI